MNKSLMKKLLEGCLALSIVVLTQPAWAQVQKPTETLELKSADLKDASVFVLQKRTYSKRNRFEITPVVVASLQPTFVGSVGAGVSVAYHIRETFAVEILSTIPGLYHGYYSDFVIDLQAFEGLTPDAVDLKQVSYWSALSLQFSALYGKFDVYGQKWDYDLYISGGFGYAQTLETCGLQERDCEEAEGLQRGLRSPITTTDRNKFALSMAIGMRFFFADWGGLRLEVRNLAYSDRRTEFLNGLDASQGTSLSSSTSTDIRNTPLVIAGIGFLL